MNRITSILTYDNDGGEAAGDRCDGACDDHGKC